MLDLWGGGEKYYSASDERYAIVSYPRLEALIKKYSPQAKERVERAYKQWNAILRDQLRNETGLRLTVGEEAQAVPVSIEDGLPLSVKQVLEGFDDDLDLLLNLPLFEKAADGLESMLRHYAQVTRLTDFHDASSDEVQRVKQLTKALVVKLKEIELLKKLAGINEDILGAYFFKRPKVCLFWLPIAMVSVLLNLSVEGLTVVILGHELAHAYTHLGRDIDGYRWESGFAEADLQVVEGLAQFYTSVICQKLQTRFPAPFEAYEQLLKHQSAIYSIHQKWAESHDSRGEIVRAAMIKCRKLSINDYRGFDYLLQEETERLRK
jgi:hypothetical protein